MPFFISHSIPEFIDCWFETVSGFTTTGASILTEVEHLPMSILFWRSFTHWIGGMGVLVFLLAVIPLAKGNGDVFYLFRAESPGPRVGKLLPTMRHTARILYLIYIVMTIMEIILLRIGQMPMFDAVTNSLATAGTGGFAIKNISIAAYSSYSQVVIAIFMMLFGVNFSLFYLLLMRQFKTVFKNEELRMYLGVMAASTLIIFLAIVGSYHNAVTALKDSFFQVSSIMTTTGFATTDFNKWPQIARFLLVILMFFGASAGSTGGGIKMSRVLITLKSLKREIVASIHPRTIKRIMMDGKPVEDSVVKGTNAFLIAYFFISITSMLLISLDNFSMEATITAVIACINNIGPGLDIIGPAGNYHSFSAFSKFVLTIDMLTGRLEIFPMLILFAPSTWNFKLRHYTKKKID